MKAYSKRGVNAPHILSLFTIRASLPPRKIVQDSDWDMMPDRIWRRGGIS